MDGLRIVLLAGAIATTMGGALYSGVRAERGQGPTISSRGPAPNPPSQPSEVTTAEPASAEIPTAERASAELEVADAPVADESVEEAPGNDEAIHPALTVEIDVDEEIAAEDLYPEYLDPSDDTLLAGDVHLGRLAFGPYEEANETGDETPVTAQELASGHARSAQSPRRRRHVAQPSWPRLHPDPGVNSILVARRMIANRELIQGSCYHYLSVVYERAGHRSWRHRRIVYHAGREGPYADVDLIRPGDWLYIVNDPGRTPVGTHSVMFVRWEDRARGWARVISHPGWGAPRSGREGTYDVTRTYRIIRPTN